MFYNSFNTLILNETIFQKLGFHPAFLTLSHLSCCARLSVPGRVPPVLRIPAGERRADVGSPLDKIAIGKLMQD